MSPAATSGSHKEAMQVWIGMQIVGADRAWHMFFKVIANMFRMSCIFYKLARKIKG
jgi:hypothetical protein